MPSCRETGGAALFVRAKRPRVVSLPHGTVSPIPPPFPPRDAGAGLVRHEPSPGMIGTPPSARPMWSDPAQHACDFSERYAEPINIEVESRMMELGIDPLKIGWRTSAKSIGRSTRGRTKAAISRRTAGSWSERGCSTPIGSARSTERQRVGCSRIHESGIGSTRSSPMSTKSIGTA